MARQLLILLFSLFFASLVSAETKSVQPNGVGDAPAVRVVREFYAWYGKCADERMADFQCANTPQGRRYVHSALRKWLTGIRELEREIFKKTGDDPFFIGYDYFWQAQDFDVFTVAPGTYSSRAVVSVQFSKPYSIQVTLKREDGVLKIIMLERLMPVGD